METNLQKLLRLRNNQQNQAIPFAPGITADAVTASQPQQAQMPQQGQMLQQAPAQSQTPVIASSQPAQTTEQVLTENVPVFAQSRNNKSPTMQNIQDSMALQQDAILKEAQAGASQATAESQELNRIAKEQEAIIEQNKQSQLQRQTELQQKYDALNTKIAELDSVQIDPAKARENFWNNKSTGQKIMTGIGLFLGSFGSSGGNSAVRVIENAIDADIKAQMTNLANKRQGLSDQKSLIGEMAKSFSTQAEIENAARVAALSNAQTKLNAELAKYKSPMIQAQGQKLYAQLEQQKQESILKFEQAAEAAATEKAKLQALVGGDNTRAAIFSIVPENDRSSAIKELGEFKKVDNISKRIDNLLSQAGAEGGVIDRAKGDKIKGEIMQEIQTYLSAAQRTPSEAKGIIDQAEQALKSLTGATRDDIPEIKSMALGIVQNLANTPTLDGYGIKPSYSVSQDIKPEIIERVNPRDGKVYLFDKNTKKLIGTK